VSNRPQTARKKPVHGKGKDLPRYPAIDAYEAEFKRVYAKMLGDCMAEVVVTFKKLL